MPTDETFHEKLLGKLRHLIHSRKFAPGAKFLAEREVAARFDTSRPTANKALSRLVSEGVLEFRRGAGTFVREGVLDYDLQRLVSFTDKARATGRKPTTKVLTFQRLKAADAPREIMQALEVKAHEPLIFMERLRLADGEPVIHERRYLIARHCPALTKADLTGSLYAALTQRCKLRISGADDVIRAVNVGRSQAALLRVPAGTACLLVIGTGFLEGARPLWHEETLYRADAYEFRNQLGGVETPRPALGRIRRA